MKLNVLICLVHQILKIIKLNEFNNYSLMKIKILKIKNM